jgi:hypothetical protein
MRRAAVACSALLLLAAALTMTALAAPAVAAPEATLRAKLRPRHLGEATAVSIGFHLRRGLGEALPPLDNFSLRLPRGMGFAASELGLATCMPARLLSLGAAGCPAESLMGTGSAQVRVPFGAQIVSERAGIQIFMTSPVEERTTTLFYFDGRKPVIAPIVLQSQVVTPEGTSDSILDTPVQAIPTAPDGPEATLVALRSTIGPAGLRYYRRIGKRRVAYRPQGLSLPARCPSGGFRFAAGFRFRDGSQARATATVPCPRAAARAAQGRRGQG